MDQRDTQGFFLMNVDKSFVRGGHMRGAQLQA